MIRSVFGMCAHHCRGTLLEHCLACFANLRVFRTRKDLENGAATVLDFPHNCTVIVQHVQ